MIFLSRSPSVKLRARLWIAINMQSPRVDHRKYDRMLEYAHLQIHVALGVLDLFYNIYKFYRCNRESLQNSFHLSEWRNDKRIISDFLYYFLCIACGTAVNELFHKSGRFATKFTKYFPMLIGSAG